MSENQFRQPDWRQQTRFKFAPRVLRIPRLSLIACLVAIGMVSGAGAVEPQFVGGLFPAGDRPGSSESVDLDGDNIPDVVMIDFNTDELLVLIGNGDGTFQNAITVPETAAVEGLSVGDVDGNTIPDLVTVNSNPSSLRVRLGNGDGTFQNAIVISSGLQPASVALADLDGDSNLDIVAGHYPGSVSVRPGNGDGTFRPATAYQVGAGPVSIAIADVGGDGVPDIMTGNQTSSDVTVLFGDDNGSFQNAFTLTPGENAGALVVTDLDGDTQLDIAVLSRARDEVSVLLNLRESVVAPSVPTQSSAGIWVLATALLLLGGSLCREPSPRLHPLIRDPTGCITSGPG